jgi:hypothetical protein
MPITPRRALWLDGACALFGAGVHVVVASQGGLGVPPRVWLTLATASVLYAVAAWASTGSPRRGLARMVWLNRGWVAVCLIVAAAIAGGVARPLLCGEAAIVAVLSLWEARVLGAESR